jgi:uncharacterized membrane protein (DUF485 family)
MEDHLDEGAVRRARLGLMLFIPYCLLYGGFVGLAVVDPALLARVVGPLNVALAYGIVLIAGALVLAVIYMRLCASRRES